MSSFQPTSGDAPVHNAVTSEVDSTATTGTNRDYTGAGTGSGYGDSGFSNTTGAGTGSGYGESGFTNTTQTTSSRYDYDDPRDMTPANTTGLDARSAEPYPQPVSSTGGSYETDRFEPSQMSNQASDQYDSPNTQRGSSTVATSTEPLLSSGIVKGQLQHGPGEVDDSVRVAAVPRSNSIIDPDRDSSATANNDPRSTAVASANAPGKGGVIGENAVGGMGFGGGTVERPKEDQGIAEKITKFFGA